MSLSIYNIVSSHRVVPKTVFGGTYRSYQRLYKLWVCASRLLPDLPFSRYATYIRLYANIAQQCMPEEVKHFLCKLGAFIYCISVARVRCELGVGARAQILHVLL